MPADYPLFCQWWESAGMAAPGEDMLPATGFVVEDASGPCGALFCYLDNSRGVAFPHWISFAHRLRLSQKMAAGRALVLALEIFLQSIGYGLMIMQTLPGIAPVLRKLGFTVDTERAVTLHKFLPHGS